MKVVENCIAPAFEMNFSMHPQVASLVEDISTKLPFVAPLLKCPLCNHELTLMRADYDCAPYHKAKDVMHIRCHNVPCQDDFLFGLERVSSDFNSMEFNSVFFVLPLKKKLTCQINYSTNQINLSDVWFGGRNDRYFTLKKEEYPNLRSVASVFKFIAWVEKNYGR